jgi:MFS transporter, DHA2 family, multidrug resistance protein
MSKTIAEFSLPQTTAASDEVQPTRRFAAIFAVLAAMMLVVLDAAIANVALPSIAQSLHVTPAMSVLIVTAYQMALVMALLPCAALGESLGYRRVFTAGVALFTVPFRRHCHGWSRPASSRGLVVPQ